MKRIKCFGEPVRVYAKQINYKSHFPIKTIHRKNPAGERRTNKWFLLIQKSRNSMLMIVISQTLTKKESLMLISRLYKISMTRQQWISTGVPCWKWIAPQDSTLSPIIRLGYGQYNGRLQYWVLWYILSANDVVHQVEKKARKSWVKTLDLSFGSNELEISRSKIERTNCRFRKSESRDELIKELIIISFLDVIDWKQLLRKIVDSNSI